nr:hypothetical protein [Acinetobacter sp. Marseille-Q1620]
MSVAGNPGLGIIFLIYFFVIQPLIIFLALIFPENKINFLRFNSYVGIIYLLNFTIIVWRDYELENWDKLTSILFYSIVTSNE